MIGIEIEDKRVVHGFLLLFDQERNQSCACDYNQLL